MKSYAAALLLGTLYLASPFAQADVIDDAIGNIQQAFSDAYKPGGDRVYHDDSDDPADRRRLSRQDEARYRQLEDRRRSLDERQNQLDRERQQLDDEESRLQDDDDR
ncbi:DDRRRQL repeat protein YjdP [Cedecea neteri]|uniref:DDRRRQL repeat protein YjdP n=1 Tax=Cedecea neteri TaxID=158822 RepID=UPI0005D8D0DF|nr:DDRRRQL repeat protein YjdP [Cedecea neteri]AJZ87729.1 membrane protein [Klebsiella michiganensis]WPU22759.1 DDRRRQL repeat protein YjdP [Cedecea neteri]